MADNAELVWTFVALALLFGAGILLAEVRESAEESEMHLIEQAEIVIYDSTTDDEVLAYRGKIIPRVTEIVRVDDLHGPVTNVKYEYGSFARLQVSVFVEFSDNDDDEYFSDAL